MKYTIDIRDDELVVEDMMGDNVINTMAVSLDEVYDWVVDMYAYDGDSYE